MAAGIPGIRTMFARQRFSATQVTSMTKGRPAIVRSKRCRTNQLSLDCCEEEQRQILRIGSTETSETKDEASYCFVLGRGLRPIWTEKYFLVLRSTGNS